MAVKRGSSPWILKQANILKNNLLGIEIHSTTNKISHQIVSCHVSFLVSEQPTREMLRALHEPQVRTKKIGQQAGWELRFIFFPTQPCPSAEALVETARRYDLIIPEGVIFTENFCGMYKEGIIPTNTSTNSFVFNA